MDPGSLGPRRPGCPPQGIQPSTLIHQHLDDPQQQSVRLASHPNCVHHKIISRNPMAPWLLLLALVAALHAYLSPDRPWDSFQWLLAAVWCICVQAAWMFSTRLSGGWRLTCRAAVAVAVLTHSTTTAFAYARVDEQFRSSEMMWVAFAFVFCTSVYSISTSSSVNSVCWSPRFLQRCLRYLGLLTSAALVSLDGEPSPESEFTCSAALSRLPGIPKSQAASRSGSARRSRAASRPRPGDPLPTSESTAKRQAPPIPPTNPPSGVGSSLSSPAIAHRRSPKSASKPSEPSLPASVEPLSWYGTHRIAPGLSTVIGATGAGTTSSTPTTSSRRDSSSTGEATEPIPSTGPSDAGCPNPTEPTATRSGIGTGDPSAEH